MEIGTIVMLAVLGILGLLVVIGVAGSFFTVSQQTAAVVERFGKFARIARAGLNFKTPFIESVRGPINLRVQQLDVKVETKTQDNVFVHVIVSVQYSVLEDKIYEAFYRLQNAEKQIESFVFDVVRAHVPKMNLDDVFSKKDEIADAVKRELADPMGVFGYSINKALVTNIDPDEGVKKAMNEINAAQREQVAAQARGEAEKILAIKKAEAQAESKRLQGEGIANERKAIAKGLRESVELIHAGVPEANPEHVLEILMMTQANDTLMAIGANSRTNVLFVPNSPGGLQQLLHSMLTANIAADQLAGTDNAQASHGKKTASTQQ